MKHAIKIMGLLITVMLLVNCSKGDDNRTETFTNDLSIEQLVGTWRISYFWDQTEETSDFADYLFTFDLEEEITITVNGNVLGGDFYLYQDFVGDQEYWILDAYFNVQDAPEDIFSILNDLTEEWIVKRVNSDATNIEFEERESSNPPEILHFTKVLDSN